MRKIREVLRLTFEAGLNQHQVAASVRLSQGAVSKYLALAKMAGLGWPLPSDLDDLALDQRLFPRPAGPTPGCLRFVAPDLAAVHSQLKRKGLTLQLLWAEYRAIHGAQGYSYSQYCSLYRRLSR